METSPLIFSVNQWTGFYIIRTSVIKEVIEFYISSDSTPIPENLLEWLLRINSVSIHSNHSSIFE